MLRIAPRARDQKTFIVGQDFYGKKKAYFHIIDICLSYSAHAATLLMFYVSRYLNSVYYGSIGCKVFNGDIKIR